MAYIYIIKNDINDKVYIGKTTKTIQERFKEHIREYKKERCEKRPLYNAMNKYGLEHFWIEELEKCNYKIVNKREVYWINKYNSYKAGYNATKGGDGSLYLDYKNIIKVYKKLNSLAQTAQECCCSIDSIKKILTEHKINISKINNFNLSTSKPVYCTEYNKSFNSITEASEWIFSYMGNSKKAAYTHIKEACNGKRKQAYGLH